MSNLYDIYRNIQNKKTECYNKRSANFIVEGALSIEITQVKESKDINAAIVFNHKEGAEDVIVYTLKEDNVLKGDYFIYKGIYFLVYKDELLTDVNLYYKKQRALECNVNFTLGIKHIYGYFISGLRTEQSDFLQKNMIILPKEESLLIIYDDEDIKNNVELSFGEKFWQVSDYDKISNAGIKYVYLERITKYIEEELEEVNNNTAEIEVLYPLIEYTFATTGAYFLSSSEVTINSRKTNEVKIIIPLGVSTITISTKNSIGEIITKTYEVVG